jgi:hypothetical protein
VAVVELKAHVLDPRWFALEVVMGWVVLETRRADGQGHLTVRPIFDDAPIDLTAGDRVVGVLPAIPGTVKVSGLITTEPTTMGNLPQGVTDYASLGIAVPGNVEPDWEEERLRIARGREPRTPLLGPAPRQSARRGGPHER